MQIIPVQDYGLLLAPEIAPYFILAAGRKSGDVPKELLAAEKDGTLATKATWKAPRCVFEDTTLYAAWRAKEDVEDAFGDAAPMLCLVSEFEGTAATIPDKNAPLGETGEPVVVDGVEYSYGDRRGGQEIGYMPLDRAPAMYEAAYENKAAMVRETMDKLAAIGVELPGGEAAVARYLVAVSGTTCV